MSKKSAYQPHRPLPTKQSDSTAGEYNRSQNREVIEDELTQIGQQLISEAEFIASEERELDEEAEAILQQEMYERGFHFEMPEN